MYSRSIPSRITLILIWISGISLICAGCSQTHHRKQADREAYRVIEERNDDPRWAVGSVSIDADPRSRFFDSQDPDHSAMPIDDPTSNQYMKRVNGVSGWSEWGKNGVRSNLENPAWRSQLGEYSTIDAEGNVELSIDSALRLAYLHSPLHQNNLETLYLSSLDVTAQRFRLDTQFFGGSGTSFVHRGDINPVAIAYSQPLGHYVVGGPFERPETNRFSVPTDLQARRRLATAGEVLIGFANSFTWDFTGSDASLGSSLANFSFVQPLLRGAGKKIALEQLTQAERRLLGNLRAYAQFRQGFFTQVVIGELGVSGPQRFGTSTQLQSFSGFGGVGGYLGLLQQSRQIRNTQATLRLQRRTRDRLQAQFDNELTDIVQLDRFKQDFARTAASLLDQQNGFQLAVDNYKTQIMGLPADLPLSIDETLLKDFQLVPVEADEINESLIQLQRRIGWLSGVIDLRQQLAGLAQSAANLGNLSEDEFLGYLQSLAQIVTSLTNALTSARNGEMNSDPDDADLYTEVEKLNQLSNEIDRINEELGGREKENEEVEGSPLAAADDLGLLKAGFDLCNRLIDARFSFIDADQQLMASLESAKSHVSRVEAMRELAEAEVMRVNDIAAERERTMSSVEVIAFRQQIAETREKLDELSTGETGVKAASLELDSILERAANQPVQRSLSSLSAWIQEYSQIAERLSLIPAQMRLELITVPKLDLTKEQAFEIALENRLDFMNGRAALVDRWRAIEIAANELESNLSITGDIDLSTARNNMLDFRGGTSSLQLGLEFDAPLARLLERNGYRESLIDFQRARRQFIQSRDTLQKGLRALLRTLEIRTEQLEIQRRAVAIALRRSEQTQLSLLAPPPQLQPGQRQQVNPNQAYVLQSSQGALLSSQNGLLSAWLGHYATRLRLYRELGIMKLDSEGRWIENPIDADFNQESPAQAPGVPRDPAETSREIRDPDVGSAVLAAVSVKETSVENLAGNTGQRSDSEIDSRERDMAPLRSAARPQMVEFPVR